MICPHLLCCPQRGLTYPAGLNNTLISCPFRLLVHLDSLLLGVFEFSAP
jgi:hypothetical protein